MQHRPNIDAAAGRRPMPRIGLPAEDIMTGDEFAAIRKRLGLSIIEFGLALGYAGNDNSISVIVRRYERGEKPVPPWIARLAMMFERYGIPDDFE